MKLTTKSKALARNRTLERSVAYAGLCVFAATVLVLVSLGMIDWYIPSMVALILYAVARRSGLL